MWSAIIKYIYFSFIIVIVFSCSACFFSATKSNPYSNGEITNLKNPEENFKFFYSIDSVDNFRFKFYTSSGFKIFDGIFHRDSLEIIYLIDDSYRLVISDYYKKFHNKVCLNTLLTNIFRYNLNQEKYCYNAIRDSLSDKVFYNVYSIDYSRVCRIEYDKVVKLNKKFYPVQFFISLENAEKYKIQLNN